MLSSSQSRRDSSPRDAILMAAAPSRQSTGSAGRWAGGRGGTNEAFQFVALLLDVNKKVIKKKIQITFFYNQ